MSGVLTNNHNDHYSHHSNQYAHHTDLEKNTFDTHLDETGVCIEYKQQIFSTDIFMLWTSCIFRRSLAETSFIHIEL